MVLYTQTPSYDDYIMHYGVKGMKWRHRKGISSAYNVLYSRNDIESLVDRAKLVGGKGNSGKSSSASKKESSGSKSGKTLAERIEAVKEEHTTPKKKIGDLSYLQVRDESQLPKIRANAKKLEELKKRPRK